LLIKKAHGKSGLDSAEQEDRVDCSNDEEMVKQGAFLLTKSGFVEIGLYY